jgi:hypothetical protein
MASISDATIWSVTFDDNRSVNYDRNSFIIQATGLINKKIICAEFTTLDVAACVLAKLLLCNKTV